MTDRQRRHNTYLHAHFLSKTVTSTHRHNTYVIINTMTKINTPYEDLLTDILENGEQKADRTGTGTLSVFGRQLRYNLKESFPLITTKKVYFHGVVGELLWFLSGDTNISWLNDNKIHIWDDWADEKGNLGPIYSAQWRNWKGYHGGVIDQISHSLDLLKTNPDSRRNIVSAWNVGDLDYMALEPCHAMFQLYVSNGKLSIQVYQRSADMFLGVPFNIASYALLCHMFAQQADLEVGELIWTGGDCHIYNNHIDQVKEQLAREPRPYPQLKLKKAETMFTYTFDHISLENYNPHPTIKAPVAV